MYSLRQQKTVARTSALGEVPRRQLLRGAGALGVAAILRPTAAFAECDDDTEPLGPFGPWSKPINLGSVVNSPFDERFPAISKNSLSLYITSTRPGGVNGANPEQIHEIWVSQRTSIDSPWGPPSNLGPVINSVGGITEAPDFSPDGHLMFFDSLRAGGCGGIDLWVSQRTNKRNDFGWQEPVNLGCVINSPFGDALPTYFEDEETGIITMYLTSGRPPAGPLGHKYVSTLGDDGAWGPAVFVPELSSPFLDSRTAIRRDGLELFMSSTRPGGVGVADIWVSTRESTADPWSTPVTVGMPVNYPGSITGGPALSCDGTTLYFTSDRPGGFGAFDVYVSRRRKLREHDDDEISHRR
jgi:hypothetical protein